MTRISNATTSVLGQTAPAANDAITAGYLLQHFTSGNKFVWVSNTQVKLSPAGLDGKARIAMWDGSVMKGFETSSDITAAITSSGANGLDTGAEAASTFYYVWAIGKSDGTLALLLSVSSSSPTMPSGYTFKRLLWGVANDGSSNFATFDHLKDGKCLYTITQVNSARGINCLDTGNATSATAVSLAKAAPDVVGVEIGLQVRGANVNATNSQLIQSEDSGQTVRPVSARTLGQTGTSVVNAEHWDYIIRNTGSLTTSWYYKWTVSTANLDAEAGVQWWSLSTRW